MTERSLNEDILLNFKEHLVIEEKSPATIEKYLRDTRAFFAFIGYDTITKEKVIEYKQFLIEQKYAVKSINSMLASINSLFCFLGWQSCRVKSLKVQRQIYCTEEKKLTKEEYMRLLEASKHKVQLNLILQTICSTGIRVSELKYFTVEAVRKGEISVQCKNKARRILIPGKLKKRLLLYAKKSGIKTGVIFVARNGKPLDRSSIWARMKRLCDAANVNPSKVFPHNLRKLFARTFYGIEKDIAKLADILGHGSIETTRIYIMLFLERLIF